MGCSRTRAVRKKLIKNNYLGFKAGASARLARKLLKTVCHH
jgi:hypothetical protein